MAKIYTKTGDTGETGLVDGSRVAKDHIRVAAYGDIDELNAALGVVRGLLVDKSGELGEIGLVLENVQHRLFDLGSELAAPDPSVLSNLLGEVETSNLEKRIDHFTAGLPELREFILPGGTPVASWLHLARCICRRAERSMVTLAAEKPIRPALLVYVNRLSDLLFVLARAANLAAGQPDVKWEKSGKTAG